MSLTLLHSKWPTLHRVLAVLSAKELKDAVVKKNSIGPDQTVPFGANRLIMCPWIQERIRGLGRGQGAGTITYLDKAIFSSS